MKRAVGTGVALLLVLGAAWLLAATFQPAGSGVPPPEGGGTGGRFTGVRVGDATLRAEIARTSAEHTRGLSGRDRLADDAGMLFVFPEPAQRTFWMKDTRIPLDMVWLRGGRVIGITANVQPEPRIPDEQLRRYPSPGPVDHVLEVNAGWAERHGVTVGDPLLADLVE